MQLTKDPPRFLQIFRSSHGGFLCMILLLVTYVFIYKTKLRRCKTSALLTQCIVKYIDVHLGQFCAKSKNGSVILSQTAPDVLSLKVKRLCTLI